MKLTIPGTSHMYLVQHPKKAAIPYEAPPKFIVSAIRRFIPSYLSDPPSSEQGKTSVRLFD